MLLKNQWNHAREQLKLAMKQEITLMREILANMHQEEISLLNCDKGNWTSLMQQRSHIVQRLSDLRLARIDATAKLEGLLPSVDQSKKFTIEQVLCLDEEAYHEILLLRDQFFALLERMNFQNHRNSNLFTRIEHDVETPYPPFALTASYSSPKRKRAAVITYDFEQDSR